MKIGELAKQSGMAASRIRFYEASGLVGKVSRSFNGYRTYSDETLQTLEIISIAQQVGFNIDEIRSLLSFHNKDRENDKSLVKVLRKKIEDIEQLQKRLKKNRVKLLDIVEMIENKPPLTACRDNTKRVLKKIRGVRAPKGSSKRPS